MSQSRWIERAENESYHDGTVSGDRVREWRKANPDYWKRKKQSPSNTPSQDLAQVIREFALQDSCRALQDSWPSHLVGLVGLIAWLRGSALQETIAADLRAIMVEGNAILAALETHSLNTDASRPPAPC